MVKRVLIAILALVLLLLGGALGAAAIWTHDAFDEGGVMRFDAGTITPGADARSTIVDIDRFAATIPYIGEFGTTRLSVTTGERGDPSNTLFMGAAATPDVDAFVKGSAYAVGIRDGDDWTTREVPGTLIPPLPRDQAFWLAQEVGRNPGIVVPSERPLTLLVMHPSGIPSGPIVLTIDFAIPQAQQWALGMAVAGGLLILLGLILLIVVIRIRGRRTGQHEASDAVAEPVVEPAAIADDAIEADPVVEIEADPVVEIEADPVVEADVAADNEPAVVEGESGEGTAEAIAIDESPPDVAPAVKHVTD